MPMEAIYCFRTQSWIPEDVSGFEKEQGGNQVPRKTKANLLTGNRGPGEELTKKKGGMDHEEVCIFNSSSATLFHGNCGIR